MYAARFFCTSGISVFGEAGKRFFGGKKISMKRQALHTNYSETFEGLKVFFKATWRVNESHVCS